MRFIVSADGAFADGDDVVKSQVYFVPTFKRATPFSVIGNYFSARRRILDEVSRSRPAAVVTLMPHVWTPVLAPSIRKLGVKYIPIIHDARPHPGDRTAWVTKWLLRDASYGDAVITLSEAVAQDLIEQDLVDPSRVMPLFHPDLTFQDTTCVRKVRSGDPLRLLFFGRVMAYKGLPLLIEAIETLRDEGLHVELGVAGPGDLGNDRARLEALGAEIVNRWIDESEVSSILTRYDAVACPHIEASQSGVVAAAFGHGMPVVAMPIGGIAEQVIPEKTGLLARDVSAPALADAIRRLATEPGLYDAISESLTNTAAERSMGRFLSCICDRIEVS